jgi:SAM-dependent methyltransferase
MFTRFFRYLINGRTIVTGTEMVTDAALKSPALAGRNARAEKARERYIQLATAFKARLGITEYTAHKKMAGRASPLDLDRPDPMSGRQASKAYAAHYAAHHRAAGNTFDARLLDCDLVLLDGLLRDYKLLDVGCATGGYLRLLKNHAQVTGLDFSAPTIEQARELQKEFGIERVEYVVSKFEDFDSDPESFDAIRLRGTFGAYQPWPASLVAIDKARTLLKAGGIVIASHFEPPNLAHRIKARLRPTTTLAITRRDFEKLWTARGFEFLFDIRLPYAVVTFWRQA